MSGAGYYSLQEGLDETNSSKPCPEEKANLLSRITYWWVHPLLFQGYKTPLEQHDLYFLPPPLDAQVLSDQLVIDWNKKRPLVRALASSFVSQYWFVSIIKFFSLLCVFVNPFLLRALIGSVKNGTTSLSGPVLTNVWQVVVLLFISTVLKATMDHRGYWVGLRCGLSARGAVMGAVYRKALKMGLSGKRHGHSTGTVTNMIAVDADAVLYFLWNAVHDIYLTPFAIIVCIVVGPAGIFGFITMVAAVPLNVWFTKSSTRFRSVAREYADQRVRLVNEVLQGIRLLKLYHWELPFRERIESIRNNQCVQVLASQRRALWTSFISALMPGTVLSVTFAAYIYLGNTLDAQVAFTALALFQSLKAPLGQLPSSVNLLSQFLIAANKI